MRRQRKESEHSPCARLRLVKSKHPLSARPLARGEMPVPRTPVSCDPLKGLQSEKLINNANGGELQYLIEKELFRFLLFMLLWIEPLQRHGKIHSNFRELIRKRLRRVSVHSTELKESSLWGAGTVIRDFPQKPSLRES